MSQNKMVTKSDLQDFYNGIYPYLNGAAHAGFTPVGTVISVMGNTAPANYLVCDGTVYNIADYQELANYFEEQFDASNFFGGDGVTTFAIPDLRGEFLRGTGTNGHSGQGSGSNVGIHQDGTRHPHVYTTEGNIIARKQNASTGISVASPDSVTTSGTYAKVASTNGTSTSTAIYTSRPTNTSVLYCIATKNIYIDAKYNYSTDEKVVGTWIDGKTMYQVSRILENELTVNAMFTYIPEFSNVEGIETVISGEVFPGTKGPDVYFITDALSQSQFNMDGACIRTNSFDITVTLQAGSVITIRYTKTTN